MEKFSTIQETVDAIQFTGKNFLELAKFTNKNSFWIPGDDGTPRYFYVKSEIGDLRADLGDYIIVYQNGSITVCKESEFKRRFIPISNE